MSGPRRPRGRAASRPPFQEPGLFGPADFASAPPPAPAPDETVVPGSTPGSAVAVSTLTRTAKDVLEGAFTPLWIRGEVSDFKSHRNGHWYFALRDDVSQIRCVVWSRDQRRIPAPPDDGMQLMALGQLTVYPARGDMQLQVRALQSDGDGLWRKALELTRSRLEADGLLAPERKRRLPRFPARIAVVTSPDGAALHDILAVLRRRCPAVEVVVAPARVQGEGAAAELCAAVELVGRWGMADLVIVGRGGGAREDLWAFNDERLARTIAACPIPTISAVGHEVDMTICDLVADLRAPTPSAAAEAAAPARDEMLATLRRTELAMSVAATRRIDRAADRLRSAAAAMARGAVRSTERRRARIDQIAGRLHALSPLAVLSRGYAVARSVDGSARTSASAFAAGDEFDLTLRDGVIRASTIRVAQGAQPSADPARGEEA